MAAALGIDKKDVICHVTLLGGGFGRKSKPDYAAEAAMLSKKLGQAGQGDLDARGRHPLRLLPHDGGRVSQGRGRRPNGKPTAWLQRSVFPPIASTFVPGAREPTELRARSRARRPAVRRRRTSAPRTAGATRTCASAGSAPSATTSTRSRAHSFADEMAHAAGRDPLEFLLDLLGPGQGARPQGAGRGLLELRRADRQVPDRHAAAAPRARVAGEKLGWGKRKSGSGWGMGIAAHRSFNTYVASVVEVEVDGSGQLQGAAHRIRWWMPA